MDKSSKAKQMQRDAGKMLSDANKMQKNAGKMLSDANKLIVKTPKVKVPKS